LYEYVSNLPDIWRHEGESGPFLTGGLLKIEGLCVGLLDPKDEGTVIPQYTTPYKYIPVHMA